MLSLASILEQQLNVAPKEAEFYGIYAMTVLYLSNAVGAFSYQELIKENSKADQQSAKLFRLTLHENRYYGLQLKLFALRLGKIKNPTTSDVSALTREFGMSKRDAKLISWLYEDCKWFKTELKAQAAKISDDCETLTMKGVEALYARIYTPLYKYVKFFTRTKLRFLVTSNNLDPEHYHSELLEKSVKAIRSTVPVDYSDLHMANHLNKAVHNHGQNIIKHGTTLKHGRLINVGPDSKGQDQFQMQCTSFNQMKLVVDSDGNEMTPEAVDEASSIAKFEVKFSISELLTRYKRFSKKYKFLTILLGEDCPEFTAWLQNQKFATATEDHVDVQSKMSVEEYNKQIAAFLEVEYAQVLRFISTLKTELPIAIS